jgi:hypothetical protein
MTFQNKWYGERGSNSRWFITGLYVTEFKMPIKLLPE